MAFDHPWWLIKCVNFLCRWKFEAMISWRKFEPGEVLRVTPNVRRGWTSVSICFKRAIFHDRTSLVKMKEAQNFARFRKWLRLWDEFWGGKNIDIAMGLRKVKRGVSIVQAVLNLVPFSVHSSYLPRPLPASHCTNLNMISPDPR